LNLKLNYVDDKGKRQIRDGSTEGIGQDQHLSVRHRGADPVGTIRGNGQSNDPISMGFLSQRQMQKDE
jgi:hypothetical protein